MYEMDLALNNLQRLIDAIEPNRTKPNQYFMISSSFFFFILSLLISSLWLKSTRSSFISRDVWIGCQNVDAFYTFEVFLCRWIFFIM